MSYSVLITPSSGLIVSISDMKDHLRVDHSDEDDLIQAYIEAATNLAQTITRRQFLEATWETRFDKFLNELILDHSPVNEIVSIKYTDSAGDEQTLASGIYEEDLDHEPARLVLAENQTTPLTKIKPAAVKVRFISGYATIPKEAVQAIRLTVGEWYEKREDHPRMMIQASERLLSGLRVLEF